MFHVKQLYKVGEKMKLMNLLDCMSNRSYVEIMDMCGDVLFTGFAIDVPGMFWNDRIYLIERNKLGIDIYLDDE